MRRLEFNLSLPPDELERLYLGVQACQAVTDEGLRVQFPAQALRPFVTHLGVRGRFELRFTDQGKFQGLSQISTAR